MRRDFAEFLALSGQDRRDVFETAAGRLDTLASYVEKDFWVCVVLDALFNGRPTEQPRVLFKGGTSLSKGFGLIRRFSEDIDGSPRAAPITRQRLFVVVYATSCWKVTPRGKSTNGCPGKSPSTWPWGYPSSTETTRHSSIRSFPISGPVDLWGDCSWDCVPWDSSGKSDI